MRENRRLVVIMAADMVGYTALMRQSEATALNRLRALREQLFEPIVAAHQGEILKRLGDGWIVAFPSVSGAVAAAQAVQTGLARRGEAELRLGLHLGDLFESEADWHGDCINIAARLQSEAEPGGVLVSEDLRRLMPAVATEAFEPAGTLCLKGVERPIEGWRWRPPADAPAIGIPRLRILPPTVQPDTAEMRLLAQDAIASIEFRLSRRTGLALLRDGAEADYVLETRFRQSGERLRASLTLRFLADDETVWSGTVEGSGDDPLDWIDRLTDRVDASVRFQTNARDSRRTEGVSAEALDVNGLLTRAAAAMHTGTEQGYAEAHRLCAMALEREPDHGMALAMWTETSALLHRARRTTPSAEEARRLRDAAERAVAAMPDSDYGLMTLSLCRSMIEGDFAGAAAAAGRALQISPAYCYGHCALAIAELGRGRLEVAREAAEAAVAHGAEEAFLPQFLALRAEIELLQGRADAAEASIAEAITRAPGIRGFLALRAAILSAAGRVEAACSARGEAEATPFRPSPLDWDYPLPAELREQMDRLMAEPAEDAGRPRRLRT